ncbi:MAG: 3-dehydroquinate synthase [Planctomycetota bacterium]|nr:3-dehydroquinate synthase [Planctomycetota bacterium]
MQTKVSFANSGLREHCTKCLKKMRPHVSSVVVVYDSAVPEYLLRQVTNAVTDNGCSMKLIKAARGEKNKTVESAMQLAKKLLKAKVDRNSLVLAVGGGVTSDVAGFAASMTLRGIRWACLPTTLLSMVDASIGGKTGVNALGAKNMIGAFHFPEFVHTDFRWLKSLPEREFRSGLGELQKTALLAGGKLWRICLEAKAKQLRKSTPTLRELVKLSAKYKAKVVAGDPKEANTRHILNLGHTFGHPLESASNGKLSHGEAVSFGIRCAISHSVEQQLCSTKLAADNLTLSRSMGLDTVTKMKVPTTSELRRLLGHDKKSKDGKLTLILIEKAGRPLVCDGYLVDDVAKIIIANQ